MRSVLLDKSAERAGPRTNGRPAAIAPDGSPMAAYPPRPRSADIPGSVPLTPADVTPSRVIAGNAWANLPMTFNSPVNGRPLSSIRPMIEADTLPSPRFKARSMSYVLAMNLGDGNV